MTLGKSIRIYLKDGTPTGIKICELVNHTIQSISSPRLKVSELPEFKESSRPGVYFLFGTDEESNEEMVYIGEAENVFLRLQDHLVNRDFWNEVVLFVSKDENLTKGHVKYLESRLIQLAFAAKRYKVENSNRPQLSSLPLADRDAMEEMLLYIKMMVGINGHKVLEEYLEKRPSVASATSPIQDIPAALTGELFLSMAGLKAEAVQSNEGIVVLKGADAAPNEASGMAPGYRELRRKLVTSGNLVLVGERLRFEKDTLFTSPSAAATVVLGYHMNGRLAWKDKQGRTLKTIEEVSVKNNSDNPQQALTML